MTPENIQDEENSAIATMIVLNSILKNELPALRNKIDECNLSNEEAIMYIWNNKKNEIKNGTATPDKNIYTKR